MKKITILIVLVAFLFGTKQIQSQAINEPANWPNTDWSIANDINVVGFTNNPLVDSNFGYDNQVAGSGAIFDVVYTDSPIYDLRPATTVVPAEEQVIVSFDYVYYQVGTTLKLQYNVGVGWDEWQEIPGNSSDSDDYKNCNGFLSFESTPLLLTNFDNGQLQNFKYRLIYSDNDATFQFGGFCIGSPTLTSRETPLCFQVSGINADSSPILDDRAVISWSDNNGTPPNDGWEIEYGEAGFAQGFGTTIATSDNPYTLFGLNSSTCYDVYIRSICDSNSDIASEWTGPFNFCTPIVMAGCGDIFYDIGGPNNDYIDGQDEVTTICPEEAGDVVTVLFDSFNTESCCDWLRIYDGDSTSSPLIGEYNGTNLPTNSVIQGMTSADIDNGGCLTFEFHSDSSITREGWSAEILCSPPVTCIMSQDLEVNEASITIHEAELSWTDNNGATPPASGWVIEYGVEDFEQGTGTIVEADSNPFTLTGLDAATNYCYYVRANCGTDPDDDFSFWEGPVCFTTKCEVFAITDTNPYIESFDNGGETPICWSQGATNAEDWLFDDDISNPGHIGNAGNISNDGSRISGGYFAYIYDGTPDSQNTTLISQYVDLSGVANPILSFFYVSNNEFIGSNVNFSVDVWDGTSWNDDVFTSNSNTIVAGQTAWIQPFVDLSAYANQTIQVRFVVDEPSGGIFDYLAIDDIYIGKQPTCYNVNNVVLENVGSNDVTLTWGDGNTPLSTAWQYVIGESGFDHTAATPLNTTDNTSFTISGLTEQTEYDIYLRSNCGGGDFSLWTGPINFKTLCNVFDAPFMEDFSDNWLLDACWTQSDSADTWQFSNNVAGPGHIGNAGDDSGGATRLSSGFFAYVDNDNPHATNNSITTPLINVNTLTSPTLYFYYISNGEGGANVNFRVDVWDGAAWNPNIFTSNSNTTGWVDKIIDISGLTITGPIQVRFTVNETNGTNTKDDFAIDDVRIDEEPDCWPIFDPITSNATTTTIDVAWTDNDNDTPPTTTYYIEYGAVGFTPGTGTTQNVDPFANPYTVTGLDVDTDWDFYVYAVCPNGESFIGPVQGTTLPTCIQVTSVNFSNIQTQQTDISWADINPITPVGGWDIQLTYPPYDQDTNSLDMFNVNTPSSTINGLIPSSHYGVYVRANCAVGDDDSSRWSGPFILNTAMGDPLNDDFDNAWPVTVSDSNCQQTFGNNIRSSETVPELNTNCYDPALDGIDNTAYNFETNDVWYTFVMPSTGEVVIEVNWADGMEDSAMAVYRVADTANPFDSLEYAESYFLDGTVNYAYSSCSDDDDYDTSPGTPDDDNKFSIIVLKNQVPGDLYYIRVWSVDASNLDNGDNIEGQFILCIRGEVDSNRPGTLVTEEETTTVSEEISLAYYPNPVSDFLSLKANSTIKSLQIYSILGQQVASKKFINTQSEVNYNMSALQTGTYFVKVLLENDKTKTIKIIKE